MSLNINSFNSNTINTLFSGISNSYKKSSGYTGIEGLLGDYSTLRSGGYGKLLKAYYSKVDTEGKVSANNKEQTSELTAVKNVSQNLMDATDALLDKSSKSIWNKIKITDEKGNTKTDFDKDAIYSSITSFVDSYNKLVDEGQKSSNTGILTQVAGMVNTSASAMRTLAKVGISIDSKNHLAIDEDFFKNKADMTAAKSLFNGTGSYVYSVATKASMTNNYASTELSNITGKKSYNNKGNYSVSANDIVSSFNTTT